MESRSGDYKTPAPVVPAAPDWLYASGCQVWKLQGSDRYSCQTRLPPTQGRVGSSGVGCFRMSCQTSAPLARGQRGLAIVLRYGNDFPVAMPTPAMPHHAERDGYFCRPDQANTPSGTLAFINDTITPAMSPYQILRSRRSGNSGLGPAYFGGSP